MICGHHHFRKPSFISYTLVILISPYFSMVKPCKTAYRMGPPSYKLVYHPIQISYTLASILTLPNLANELGPHPVWNDKSCPSIFHGQSVPNFTETSRSLASIRSSSSCRKRATKPPEISAVGQLEKWPKVYGEIPRTICLGIFQKAMELITEGWVHLPLRNGVWWNTTTSDPTGQNHLDRVIFAWESGEQWFWSSPSERHVQVNGGLIRKTNIFMYMGKMVDLNKKNMEVSPRQIIQYSTVYIYTWRVCSCLS